MILGIDLGNFSVKTSEKIRFISKISERETFDEKNTFSIEGVKYTVEDGEFVTDWNKSKKENTIPLLYYAIAKSTEDNLNQIVLGLPIQQYKKEKENLKTLIENNKIKEVVIENKIRNIFITDVEIAPESAAAYYNLDLETKNKIGNKQLLIIDIGGRTSDICLFKDRTIKEVKTVPVGMLNIYQEIIDYVNTEYTESFKLEDGEVILKEGLFLNGSYRDISFIKPILLNNFNSIWKEVQLKFNPGLGYVLLTGGGSLTLEKAFKNRIGNNLIISENPLFDNSLGFKKVGEKLWLER